MKTRNNKSEYGFSILEITISIFIISIAFIGLLSLTGQNIQAQYANENSLIASQLAQEGLELVRNKRDSNWINVRPYYDSIYDVGDSTFIIDYTTGAPDFSADSIDDPGAKLYVNGLGYYYHNNSGTAVPFRRLVTITTVNKDEYLEVECKVKWNERGKNNEYTAKTLLYAWR